jgi:hypothetical protein
MENLNCPYCNVSIVIESINCGIFRCGIYKHNHEQIPPHLSKEECNKLVKENKIWGCGQPFQLHNGKLIKCGWI